MTVKLAALSLIPEAVVTVITPVVAPTGTLAVILVALTTVNSASTPLNCTAVAPVKARLSGELQHCGAHFLLPTKAET